MNTKICPTCHSPIPTSAPGGFCPACLLRDADEPPPPGRNAPAVAEIAAAFPQLEVEALIGQGGMGFVYKARQPSLDRTVALKILSPELGRDPAFAERFAREARVLGKLSHPNIVTVFEHGESGGFFYLLMEYVDGVNLRQAMRAGRFTPEQALAVVPGICDALQAAHAQGIWHRDIKPENILLDARGGVKIADFGIARIVGDPARDFTLTATGGVLGSAAYMAPEQHEKPHDVDHRADIYSLGVVLYEMLTGELPLGRFPAPSARAAVSARIDEIVLRTLEKERELRQQSAEEVKTEVAGAATAPGRKPAAAHPADGPAPLTQWSVGLVVGGLVLAVAAVAFTHGSDQGMFLTFAALAVVLGYLGSWVALSRMRSGRISSAWRGGLRSFTWVPLIAAVILAIAAVPIRILRERGMMEQRRAAQVEYQQAREQKAAADAMVEGELRAAALTTQVEDAALSPAFESSDVVGIEKSDAANAVPIPPMVVEPFPENELFKVEQLVIMPGDAVALVWLLRSVKGGVKTAIGKPLVFRTALDRATGFILRWHAYGSEGPEARNLMLLEFVDPDTGHCFHRRQVDFDASMRLSSPDVRPLPQTNKSISVTNPRSWMTFKVLRAEESAESGAPVNEWEEVFVQVLFVEPTSQIEPAFQLPTLYGFVHPFQTRRSGARPLNLLD